MYWDKMGACFVWPPLGGTVSHVSGTKGEIPGESGVMSPNRWNANWMAYGTRQYPTYLGDKRNQRRYVAGFTQKGKCPHSAYIVLPQMLDELRWRNEPQDPQGELAAPSSQGSLQPPQRTASGKPPTGPPPDGTPKSMIAKIAMVKKCGGIGAETAGSTEGSGVGAKRNQDGNMRKFIKMRDRQERFRMLSSDPIPIGCTGNPDGKLHYDSPRRTLEILMRPQTGTDEEKEQLYHARFMYQPQDDMSTLAFNISIDQGKQNYQTEGDAFAAAQTIINQYVDFLKQKADSWKLIKEQPKSLMPHDLLDK